MSTEIKQVDFEKFLKKYVFINIKYLNQEAIKKDFIKIKEDIDNEYDGDEYELNESLREYLDDFTGESKTEEYGESWLYQAQIELDLTDDFLRIFKV